MDEGNEINAFDSKKKLFDSEARLKATFGSAYKEYDFTPDASTEQLQETEKKIEGLWRAIEKAGIVPYEPEPKSVEEEKTPGEWKRPRTWQEVQKDWADRGVDCRTCRKRRDATQESPSGWNQVSSTWKEIQKELADRGMDKEARTATLGACKLCNQSDLDLVFADEANQDRKGVEQHKDPSCH